MYPCGIGVPVCDNRLRHCTATTALSAHLHLLKSAGASFAAADVLFGVAANVTVDRPVHIWVVAIPASCGRTESNTVSNLSSKFLCQLCTDFRRAFVAVITNDLHRILLKHLTSP